MINSVSGRNCDTENRFSNRFSAILICLQRISRSSAHCEKEVKAR